MVPDDFEADAYIVVQKQAAKHDQSAPTARRSFAGAWSGVAHRYRAAHDWNLAFIDAMAAGDGPPLNERYPQEMALFVFSSAALSALECCAFAAHCLAALTKPNAFPVSVDSDLRFYPTNVRDAFLKTYPEQPLGAVLAEILKSPDYLRLADLRNALSHRGTLPRSFHVSVGSGPHSKDGAFIPSNPKSVSSDWIFDRRVDAALTDACRTWLGPAQVRLIQAIARFATTSL